jgi:uncharacterized membrane protein (UPF0127 family)
MAYKASLYTPLVAVVRKEDGAVVCERCVIADSIWLRTKGLLGRASLPDGEGILLKPGSSIHMFFMRFPIDAVFVDRELRVLRVKAKLAPWRMASKRGAKAVLELPAGSCEQRGVVEGDQLVLDED